MPYSKDHKIPSGRAEHPVGGVTWHEAVRFCDRLSKETGRCSCLPTEEEWEKAA
ncbi:MAG: formylglycine-generating enzyme family protein [Anaerolineae bacterium]